MFEDDIEVEWFTWSAEDLPELDFVWPVWLDEELPDIELDFFVWDWSDVERGTSENIA